MRQLGLFAVAVISGFGAQVAHADPEVDLVVSRTTPHAIEATIVDGPQPSASMISLRDAFDRDAPPTFATSVRRFADGPEPLAIAIVFSGEEIWIGNDDFETDDNARYAGALKGLEAAIDAMELSRQTPAGSTASVVSYSTGAQLVVPMSPLSALTGRVLGTQHDYKYKIGDDLVAGIGLGMHELEHSAAPHKALIVIGDGNDTNNEAAKDELAQLRREAKQQGIATFAIVYKSEISDPGSVITSMIPGTRTVHSFDGMAAEMDRIASQLTSRYYVTFPGTALDWDGREHDLVVQLGSSQLDSVTTFLPAWNRTSWWRRVTTGWLAQLGLGVLLVGGLIAATKLIDRRARATGA